MRFQADNHTCGPVSVANAMKCFGKRISIKKITNLCGTTQKQGTNEFGIQSALSQLGFEFDVVNCHTLEEAFAEIDAGVPIIASVVNSTHWCVFLGKIGKRTILFDPSNSDKNKKENGIHLMAKYELSKYWRGKDNKFYGIRIRLPKR